MWFATAASKSLLSGLNISATSTFTPEFTNKCIIDDVTLAPG